MWPSFKQIILSNYNNSSLEGMWIEHITVEFWDFDNLFKYFITLKAVLLSSPEVGSSKIQRFGFLIKSYPIDVLFLSPPESPLRNLPPTGVSPQS